MISIQIPEGDAAAIDAALEKARKAGLWSQDVHAIDVMLSALRDGVRKQAKKKEGGGR